MPVVFVYGALMRHPTVKEHGTVARVPDHAVRFVAGGFPIFEPRFLGMVPAEGEQAHGVVVEMNERGWEAISRHEAGYAFQEVTAWVGDVPLEAHALILLEGERAPEDWPSVRYARLVREGAEHHDLPDEVLDYYRRAEAEGARASLYLGPLMHVVRWLIPWLGPRLAMIAVLGGVAVAIAAVVGLILAWLL